MCTCKSALFSSYTSADQRQQLIWAHSFCPMYNRRPASYWRKIHLYPLLRSREKPFLICNDARKEKNIYVHSPCSKKHIKTCKLTLGAESPYCWHRVHCLISFVLVVSRSLVTSAGKKKDQLNMYILN